MEIEYTIVRFGQHDDQTQVLDWVGEGIARLCFSMYEPDETYQYYLAYRYGPMGDPVILS